MPTCLRGPVFYETQRIRVIFAINKESFSLGREKSDEYAVFEYNDYSL